MDHFYESIKGWFDFEDVYTNMVNAASDGMHFVEIGAYYGKSTAYMAVELINSGKKIRFDVVDTWRGSPEHQEGAWNYQPDMVNDTAFDVFQRNLSPAAGSYNPVKLPSLEAAVQYEDGSLDFVFIDAAHEYESVKADVAAWLPKVKKGGFLGGHDYGMYEAHRDGVSQAVNELIGKDNIKLFHTTWLTEIK